MPDILKINHHLHFLNALSMYHILLSQDAGVSYAALKYCFINRLA